MLRFPAMRGTKIDPGFETPKKKPQNNTKTRSAKRSNHQNSSDDGSSPEKRERLQKTPGTKMAEALESLSVSTPSRSTRSNRDLTSQVMKDVLRSNPLQRSKKIVDVQDDKEVEVVGKRTRSKSRSQSPARQNRVQFASPARERLHFEEDGDANMEAEEEDEENVPPPRSQPRSAKKNISSVIRKTKKDLEEEPMEVEPPKQQPKVEPGFLRIQPIRLKRVNEKEFRISNTPKTPASAARNKSRLGNKKKVVESSEEEEYDEVEEEEMEEAPKSTRRGGKKSTATTPSKNTTTPARNRTKKPKTLEDLRSFLHTSEVPERMPCREEEYRRIQQFVLEGVQKNGFSQAMYISGVPGTGKTATTQAVVNQLAKQYDFHYVAVNAMELIEPKQLFVDVYKGIFTSEAAKRISAVAARKKLNAMFEMIDRKRKPVVMLVDELDMLCTKKQEILYDIFNWTSTESARISVIAIANTLDLPERMLSQRITSRLGSNRIVFQPYTHEQIKDIICDRLSSAPDVIRDEAIELAARRVANVTGDLRKAMDILRRAIEIAVEKGDNQLTVDHVNAANKEATSVPRVAIIEALSRHAYLLFRAAVSQVQSSGLEEFFFYELYRQYRILCTNLDGIEPFHDYGIHHVLMELCSNRLLVAAPGANFTRRKVRLGMTTQEAQFAIKQAEDAKKSGRIKYTL